MKILSKKLYIEFILIIVFSGLVALFNALQTIAVRNLVDSSIVLDFSLIRQYFLVLSTVIILVLICELFRKILTSLYKKHLTEAIREKITNGLLSKTTNDFFKLSNQEYISIYNNDINSVIDEYYINFTNIAFSLLSLMVYSVTLFTLHPIMAAIVLISNIIPMIVPFLFKSKLQLRKSQYIESLRRYNLKLGDIINGFMLIRIHNIQHDMRNIMSRASKDSTLWNYKFNLIRSISEMVLGTFAFLSNFILIIAGIYFIINKELSVGGLLASIQVSELLVGPITNIAYELNSFNAVKQIKADLFKEYTPKGDVSKNILINEPIKNITIDNLSFKYENDIVLDNINLVFEQNKKYLICGQSGSGKTTLIKLLTRVYSEYTGDIKINGINLRDINEKNYFEKIGVVYQTPFIFNDTLKNNITLYKKHNETEIRGLIKRLYLGRIEEEIVSEREFKDSVDNISGGEKQKISIARILLQDKKFIILDEATSSIDNESSLKIESELLKCTDITLISIEHKINKEMIQYYDEIICLEDGKVSKIIKSEIERGNFCVGL